MKIIINKKINKTEKTKTRNAELNNVDKNPAEGGVFMIYLRFA